MGNRFRFPISAVNRSGFTVSWVDYLRHGSAVPGIIPDRVLPKLLFLHPPFLI